jgi:ABC-type multidrug transport system fused ATPase/permease subunit
MVEGGRFLAALLFVGGRDATPTKMSLAASRSLIAQSIFIRWERRALILFVAFLSALSGLSSPLFQKLFIDRLLGDVSFTHRWPLIAWTENAHPVTLILISFVFTLFAQSFSLLASYIAVSEGLILQRRYSDRLYRKMLAIRTDSLGSTTIGEVVSVYATDIPGATALIDQVSPMLAGIVFPLVFAPIAIKLICGIPLLATVGVMIAVVCMNFVLSSRQSRFFYRFKQLAAERTGIVNEWIQNIRLLRILGWIENFEQKIFAKRREETTNRISMLTNGQFMNAFGSSINFVINLVGVATLVYFRTDAVTPGELFALLWIFGVFLQRPFRQIPWFFTFSLDSLSSTRRVERFMNRPSNAIAVAEGPTQDRDQTAAIALKVRGLSLEVGGRALLKNVDFDVKDGEFIAIVGEVGSGKSLLVLSLAGETAATFETLEMIPKGGRAIDALKLPLDERRRLFAYVGQEGFVMSASLRENIMFRYGGSGEDDEVLRSLALAQFRIDGEHLQNGLETEIGERGVNLSGGQRQRVALARAHFLRRPIFLLDDCLSAVDVDTERKLIGELIDGAWHDRTRLLITHRLSVLEKVDRVLFLDDGEIVASGPFEDLLKTSQKVRDFVASVRRGEAQANDVEARTEEAQVAVEEAESVAAAASSDIAGGAQEAPDGQG